MKALVFVKSDSKKIPIGIMTKKPSAAQIKAGKIDVDLEDDDGEVSVRIKFGRVRSQNGTEGDPTFVCDAIMTHPEDVKSWSDIPGFKSFEEFLGDEEAEEDFL